MAAKQYNVMYPKNYIDRDQKEQTTFIRVGTAFPMRDADGFTLELDLPLTFVQGGRLCLFARDNDEKSDTGNGRGGGGSNNNRGSAGGNGGRR